MRPWCFFNVLLLKASCRCITVIAKKKRLFPPELLGELYCEADAQNVEFDLTAKQDKMRAIKNARISR